MAKKKKKIPPQKQLLCKFRCQEFLLVCIVLCLSQVPQALRIRTGHSREPHPFRRAALLLVWIVSVTKVFYLPVHTQRWNTKHTHTQTHTPWATYNHTSSFAPSNMYCCKQLGGSLFDIDSLGRLQRIYAATAELSKSDCFLCFLTIFFLFY